MKSFNWLFNFVYRFNEFKRRVIASGLKKKNPFTVTKLPDGSAKEISTSMSKKSEQIVSERKSLIAESNGLHYNTVCLYSVCMYCHFGLKINVHA